MAIFDCFGKWGTLVGRKLITTNVAVTWERFLEGAQKIGMHSEATNQEESLRRAYELFTQPGLRDIVTGELVAPVGVALTEADVKRIEAFGFTRVEIEDTEQEERAKLQGELSLQITAFTYEVGRLMNMADFKGARKILDRLLSMVDRRDKLIRFKTAEEERLALIRQMEAGYH